MKFNLTITDATLDELRAFLGGTSTSTPAIVKAALAPVTVLSTSTATEDESSEHTENPEGAPAFDSAGLPWDERIHSANKGTNANGTWRKRRGVDDATISAVEAELRVRNTVIPQIPQTVQQIATPQQYANGGLASSTVAPVIPALSPNGESIMPVQVAPPAPIPMTPEQFQQPAPVTPVAPVIPVQPAPVAMAFGDFMSAIAQKSSAGVIDHAYIVSLTQQTSAAIGKHLNAITDAMNIPEVIPAAIAIMQRDGKW